MLGALYRGNEPAETETDTGQGEDCKRESEVLRYCRPVACDQFMALKQVQDTSRGNNDNACPYCTKTAEGPEFVQLCERTCNA